MPIAVRAAAAAATLIAVTLVWGAAVEARVNNYGSLAIDRNAGSRYGWAVDKSDQKQADAGALARCGKGCRIVVRFQGGCAAYAVERGSGKLYGWATASTAAAARQRAEAEVRERGGRDVTIRVWGCNAR